MKRLLCWFRHRYYVVQAFSSVERRVACARCKQNWAMHDGRRAFIPWDGDFAQLYLDMGYTLIKPWK